MDHYHEYFYDHLLRETSDEETSQSKESYKCLVDTNRSRLCSFRADNGIFVDLLFKESVQTWGQYINYCGVGSCQQNSIVERRIKELILGSQTILLHTTKL